MDVFMMIRRKKTTIFTDAKETTLVGELKRMIEGIVKVPLADQRLYNKNNQVLNNSIQNAAPTPVQPPLGANLLGAGNTLSGLNSNLAAQLSSVVGLSNLTGNLQNSILSNAAAAGLSNLTGLGGLGAAAGGAGGLGAAGLGGIGSGASGLAGLGSLGGGNDGGLGNSFNQNYSSGGFGNSGVGGNRNNDYDLGSNVRNYSTAPNDDYGRNYGNINNGNNNRKSSDTIIIRNMPSAWTWQTLRDKFRDVGEVKFAEIRGQDTGVVRFAKERDAEVAIKIMDGSRFDGRTVDVTYF